MNGSYESHKQVKFGVGAQHDIELDEVDVMAVVARCFVYPSYKSVKDNEIRCFPQG